jgi:hypothetical protein
MSKRFLIVVILFSVIGGIVIGYYRGLPDDFADTPAPTPQDYGYRCGDGSEFTLVPLSANSVRIVPATSVDYVRETTLTRASSGAPFAGGDITLRVDGAVIFLSAEGRSETPCQSMRPAAESLFQDRYIEA